MSTTSIRSTITRDNDAVITEIEIAAPPTRVFQALTDARQLQRWFTDPSCPAKIWEIDPRLGGRYRYVTEEGPIVVNGVNQFECKGEILELDPPRLLVYSWVANWHDDKSRTTVVRWELFPESCGTRVKVTHSALSAEHIARKDYSGGWPGVLEQLKHFTEKN